MRFIFKLYKPFFCFSVDGYRNLYRAGVDLVAYVQIRDQPSLAQKLHAHKRHVHQTYIPFCIFSVKLIPCGIIRLQRALDYRAYIAWLNLYLFKLCQKGGMAAVVGPIGVNHTQLCYTGVAFFLIAKIRPAKFQVGKRHGKTHGAIIRLHLLVCKGGKALHPLYVFRRLYGDVQRLGLFKRCNS